MHAALQSEDQALLRQSRARNLATNLASSRPADRQASTLGTKSVSLIKSTFSEARFSSRPAGRTDCCGLQVDPCAQHLAYSWPARCRLEPARCNRIESEECSCRPLCVPYNVAPLEPTADGQRIVEDRTVLLLGQQAQRKARLAEHKLNLQRRATASGLRL